MTVQVLLNKMKYLCIPNVSIHINFYQNRFINERRKDRVFVRCRRTFVLNTLYICIKELPLDMVGSEQMENKDFFNLLSRYKFVLSMENAICQVKGSRFIFARAKSYKMSTK